ncbi:hypothetical protein Drorol1_Dr00007812, partial [Drosera rotundifolia]
VSISTKTRQTLQPHHTQIDLFFFFPASFLSSQSIHPSHSIPFFIDSSTTVSIPQINHQNPNQKLPFHVSPLCIIIIKTSTTMRPLLLTILLISLLPIHLSQPQNSVYIDCGATRPVEYLGFNWVPDDGFVSSGSARNVLIPGVVPILSSVRSFASKGNVGRKFCYEVPVVRGEKYLVRTTYFYGGVNGAGVVVPPVFDQIVDGTFWGVVNTTEDYGRNLSSYYEGVFRAVGRNLSVCIGVNTYTDSDPFISAMEVIGLDESVYNSTDFDQLAVSLVSRNSFGSNGSIIRYPDDQFDRLWQPFGSYSPVSSVPNVSTSGIWNHPPLKVFETQWTTSTLGPAELQWPQIPLPNASYYIALYFANGQAAPPQFSIDINGLSYYKDLTVTPLGLAVFADPWLLAGVTNLKLTPTFGSRVSPMINAGEIFEILPLGRRTLARDVVALESLKSDLQNPPPDWNGDPCLPVGYSWTGIQCSFGRRIRVVSLNLTRLGISGSLSPHIGNLTAITTIMLGNNFFSGLIPDLHTLKHLQILDLESNRFSGTIPSSLGDMSSLQQLHLQNNELSGTIPSSLIGKPGLNFTYSPGNHLLSPAPSPSPSS